MFAFPGIDNNALDSIEEELSTLQQENTPVSPIMITGLHDPHDSSSNSLVMNTQHYAAHHGATSGQHGHNSHSSHSQHRRTLRDVPSILGMGSLSLKHHQLTSLEGLGVRPGMTALYLSGNLLHDFLFLEAQPDLATLFVDSNQITSFRGASHMRHLTELSLKGNPVCALPHYRLMCIMAFGPQLRKVDGLPVTLFEKEQSKKFNKKVWELVRLGYNLDNQISAMDGNSTGAVSLEEDKILDELLIKFSKDMAELTGQVPQVLAPKKWEKRAIFSPNSNYINPKSSSSSSSAAAGAGAATPGGNGANATPGMHTPIRYPPKRAATPKSAGNTGNSSNGNGNGNGNSNNSLKHYVGYIQELENLLSLERQRYSSLSSEFALYKTHTTSYYNGLMDAMKKEMSTKLEGEIEEREESLRDQMVQAEENFKRQFQDRIEELAREKQRSELGMVAELEALRNDKQALKAQISALSTAAATALANSSHAVSGSVDASAPGFAETDIAQFDSILFVDVEVLPMPISSLNGPVRLSINSTGIGVLGPNYDKAITLHFDTGIRVTRMETHQIRIENGERVVVIVDGRSVLIERVVRALIDYAQRQPSTRK